MTKPNDLFNQMDEEQRTKLESKTEEGNLVKLPFESELGNPIYVPENSEALELITNMQKAYESLSNTIYFDLINEYLHKALPKQYSAKSITEFSKVLTKDMITQFFESDRTSTLLNYLIQKSSDSDHEIHIEQSNLNLKCFGAYNSKNIDVFGDLQNSVGNFQHCGMLNIHGNVGNFAGSEMYGGTIWIKGNTGKGLGSRMKRGIIHVEGDIESISNRISGGDIYHKGKQIVKNGKIIDDSYGKWWKKN